MATQIDVQDVQPAAQTAPAAANPELGAAPAAQEVEIPDEVSNNPLVKDILVGKIPGVRVPDDQYYPKAMRLAEKPENLMNLGLAFYFAEQEDSTVLYNPAQISETELQTADQQGTLSQIIPDYGILTGETPQKPPWAKGKGVETFGGGKAAGRPQSAPAPGVVASPGTPPPARVQTRLASDRVKALNVVSEGPTSGPMPGAGRVANALAVPAR